jgi:outer membrane protein OmpA-like peptidoglycan-associated protein
MKTTVISLAAALMLGTSLGASAQEQDPNAPLIVIPEAQPAPQADQQSEQPVKKRKQKEQAEQPQEAAPQAVEEQVEQPVKKRKKKEQAEQPQEAAPQAVEDQIEQPVKKRKKKEQAEQPQDLIQPPAEEQAEQPVKKRKKKEQAEQPQEPVGQPIEEQAEQPVKKKKKEQAEQPQDLIQPPVEEQAGQPVKKKKPQTETTEQPVDQTQPAPEQTTGQPQTEQPVAGEASPDVTKYLSDTRSPKELSDEELAERAKTGRELSRTKGLSDDVRKKLAAEGRKARAEALARQQGKGDQQQTTEQPPILEQPPAGEATKGDQMPPLGEGQPAQPTEQAAKPNPDKQEVQQLDGNKSSPEAENKARAYLDDSRPADQLNENELRDRLDGMRELMAGNQLSRDSERALREKLRNERGVLRGRVAEKVVVEEDKGEVIPGRERRRDRNDRKWDNWAERDVLRDRRRSEDLEEGELRRRIDIYREAAYDERYDAEERAYWRDTMERDRGYLRKRLIRDRGDRERYWRDRRDKNELNIEINIDLGADREPPESAFMDEIDDEELETYLVAAPRRKIGRRYTIEEIEEEPEVRTAMPAIEVDNIHFGFNEAVVREEEVDNLDRLAEVIEKILAAHPGEVFMIEGHTDAVGSDAYNLRLSRARAEAVKKALAAYYAIPARNLKAVGYGERYLKIPTSDQEEENRRVSLRRVTPLVGEADAAELE